MISSREYKLMLDPRVVESKESMRRYLELFEDLCSTVDIEVESDERKLKAGEQREVQFFDTPDLGLYRRDYILRRRTAPGGATPEFTLKRRALDRLIAGALPIKTDDIKKAEVKVKIEEDVAAPFRIQVSQSASIEFKGESDSDVSLASVGEARRLFPELGIEREREYLRSKDALVRVNGITAYETVYEGIEIKFPSGGEKKIKASFALIVWRFRPNGMPALVEMSYQVKFMRKDKKDETKKVLIPDGELYGAIYSANELYAGLQRLPVVLAGGTTKTRFVYGA